MPLLKVVFMSQKEKGASAHLHCLSLFLYSLHCWDTISCSQMIRELEMKDTGERWNTVDFHRFLLWNSFRVESMFFPVFLLIFKPIFLIDLVQNKNPIFVVIYLFAWVTQTTSYCDIHALEVFNSCFLITTFGCNNPNVTF